MLLGDQPLCRAQRAGSQHPIFLRTPYLRPYRSTYSDEIQHAMFTVYWVDHAPGINASNISGSNLSRPPYWLTYDMTWLRETNDHCRWRVTLFTGSSTPECHCAWLGDIVNTGRWTCDQEVAGSTAGSRAYGYRDYSISFIRRWQGPSQLHLRSHRQFSCRTQCRSVSRNGILIHTHLQWHDMAYLCWKCR